MKFKHGDKVKIIQRKPGNTTGSVNYNKPNRDVGKVCYVLTHNSRFLLREREDGIGDYYGLYDNSEKHCFQDDDLELVSDDFVLPERWCVKIDNNYDVINQWGRTYWEPITGWGNLDIYHNYMLCCFKEKYCTSDYEQNGYTEITYDQFKQYVLKDTMETTKEPKFEVGKWYKYIWKWDSNKWYYGQFSGYGKSSLQWDIWFRTDGSNLQKNAAFIDKELGEYSELTDLSEIQQYLPDGHVDKVKVIPEYVRCTLPFSDQTTGNIYKVSPDGYVEDNKGSKSIFTWNGGGFEKSTKEAYDAQFKPMEKNEFKKGDYIVITKCNSRTTNGKLNHCYKLIDNDYTFKKMSRIPLDEPHRKKARYATPEEIAEYDRLDEPYDVTTLIKKEEPNKSLVGRYLKVIEDYANGSNYEEGDYIQIVSDDLQGRVKCNKNYSFGQGEYDWNNSEVELMPEGFVPPTKSKAVSEEKPEKWKPKVGDWVIILPCSSNVNWVMEMNEFVGKCVQLKDNDYYFKIDEDNGKWNWEYTERVKHFRKAEPHEIPKTEEPKSMDGYTAEEALAELKRIGFKKGVKYVYMLEDGSYDESDICTATREPKIQCSGDYIDCGSGYLWSRENPTHLHRGPISGPITKLDGVPAKLAIFEEIRFIPEHQLKTINHAFQPRINQDYSKPETLLTKTTLNY